jgi:hypothetical protein
MLKSLVAVVASVTSVASVATAHADEPDLAPPGMTAPLTAPVAVEPVDEGTPPLSGTRLVGEALLGGLFAVGGGIGGAYVGYGLETSGGCSGEFCGLGGVIVGGMVGMTFVAPVGVYLAGSHSGETGSLGAAVGGSVIGALCGIAAMAASQSEAGAVLLVAGPVVGSMIGFNVTRRYDRPRSTQARCIPTAHATSDRAVVGLAGSF